jgi:hypothetical protein
MATKDMVTRSATLSGAYGRDYRTRGDVLAAWESGVDFTIHDIHRSTYCSIRDSMALKEAGFTHLTFRNSRGVILVNIPIN